MSDKPLVWVGSSLDDMRSFPVEARRVAGFELRRVQAGLMPDDWKSLASVGPGVCEIRIHAGSEHRVLYVARFSEAVYVLHSFTKKTGRTAQQDIELAKRRLSQVIKQRKSE